MDVYTARMNEQGRVVIPAPLRTAMGLAAGSDLLFRHEDGRLVAETIESAVTEAQKLAAHYQVAGRSLADELLAERRAEAAAE